MMTEQAKEARRAYKREWNEKNRERIRKYQEDYWERKYREGMAARQEPAQGDRGGAENGKP